MRRRAPVSTLSSRRDEACVANVLCSPFTPTLNVANGSSLPKKMPVRIAYLIGHLRTGGTQKHLYELLRRLDRSRFAPRVYCLKRQGAMIEDLEGLGIQVDDLQIGASLSEPKSLLRLIGFARQLRKSRVSLLHCYLPRANFFGAIAGRLARVPAVLISKRSLESQETLKQVFLCRIADAWADALLANSQEVWRHASEVGRCRPEKLRLVPNGIDIERYRKPCSNGFHDERPIVGTVLRLEPVKGPDVFVEAAGRIAAKMPQARFIVIGEGTLRQDLERRAASLGLENRIQFLGERDDVAEILPSFSVFLLPSMVEGMSMALLEAMAAARPIVATRVGGNVDLIRDQETGLLVSPGDPDEMAAAVLRLLKDTGWAKRLGHAAQGTVVNHYSADGMVEKIERIYSDVLDGKGI